MHGPGVGEDAADLDLRRARRLLRPRAAAARDPARQHPARHPRAARPARRLRPLRLPRPGGDRVAVRAPQLRVARRARPHVDAEAHRDEVEPAARSPTATRTPTTCSTPSTSSRSPRSSIRRRCPRPRSARVGRGRRRRRHATDHCSPGNPGGTIPPPSAIVPASQASNAARRRDVSRRSDSSNVEQARSRGTATRASTGRRTPIGTTRRSREHNDRACSAGARIARTSWCSTSDAATASRPLDAARRRRSTGRRGRHRPVGGRCSTRGPTRGRGRRDSRTSSSCRATRRCTRSSAAPSTSLISRFGVMFFADPIAAFSEHRPRARTRRPARARRVEAARRERMVLARSAARSPSAATVPAPPAGAPSPFGLADGRLRPQTCSARAGFTDVHRRPRSHAPLLRAAPTPTTRIDVRKRARLHPPRCCKTSTTDHDGPRARRAPRRRSPRTRPRAARSRSTLRAGSSPRVPDLSGRALDSLARRTLANGIE